MNQLRLASCVLLLCLGSSAPLGLAQHSRTTLFELRYNRASSASAERKRVQAEGVPPILKVAGSITKMKLLAPGTGWFLAGGALAMTHDNGRHWIDITPAALSSGRFGPETAIADVSFLNPSIGYAVAVTTPPGDDAGDLPQRWRWRLLVTRDGGASWTSCALPALVTNFAKEAHVAFLNEHDGFVSMGVRGGTMGERGVALYRTSDGGAHWKAILPDLYGSIDGILPVSSRVLWLEGAGDGIERAAQSTLAVSRDGGVRFHVVSLQPPASVGEDFVATYSLPVFVDERKGYEWVEYQTSTIGRKLIVEYATRNGGDTWRIQASAEGPLSDAEEPFVVVDGHWLEVYAAPGSQFKTLRPKPGESLEYASSSATGPNLRCSASFATAQIGWALCGGSLAATADGGETWKSIF